MVEIDGIPTNVLLAAGYRTISDTANFEDGSKQVPITNLSSSLVNVLEWRWKQNANGYFWQNLYFHLAAQMISLLPVGRKHNKSMHFEHTSYH